MANVDIDFEGSAGQSTAANAGGNLANQPDTTNLGGGNNDINNPANNGGNPNGGANPQNNGNPDGGGNNNNNNGGYNNNDDASNNNNNDDEELAVGTEVEYEGNTYTVDESGNLVDKDGKVFKEKKDVAAWIKEQGTVDENEISIDAIKAAVGIDVTGEDGKPIEFTNDVEGINSYINSVVNLKTKEVTTGYMNKFFNDNPVVKELFDYIKITGSAKGFGNIPDRSSIVLDKDNENQLVAVIKMAATEFGNKSISDAYIKYLKDSGALYDEAKSQLEALVGKDKAYKKEIENKAKAAREKELNDLQTYWQNVSDAITKRNLGGYIIPESFTKEVNGQKLTITPEDFYKYVADPADGDNEDGLTGYQKDLNKLSKEEVLAKELLDAWLMFTGGTYKDLVSMAEQENRVRKLIIKSKEQKTAHTIKVNKPNKSKVNPDDILF